VLIRIPARLRVGSTETFGFIQDIGLGGLRLLSNVALSVGTPLNLQLSFGESVCFLNIAGQVVSCNTVLREETAKYAIGIKHSAVRDLDQKILAIALQTLKQKMIPQEKSLLEIIVSNDSLAQETTGRDVKPFTGSESAPTTSHAALVEFAKGAQGESTQIKEILIKSTNGVMADDKRKFFRTLLRLPLQFNIEGATYKAYVEDISPAGMLVASPLVLPIDTPLAIQLSINENQYFMNISGRIAIIRESSDHQNYLHKIGICFDDLHEPEQKILKMYLETLRNMPEQKSLENQPQVRVTDHYAGSRSAIVFIHDRKDTARQLTKRRVVITGIGTVAPNGIGREAFWKSLAEGKNCIDRISFFDPSGFPSQVAAEIRNFNPKDFIPVKEIKRMGRSAHLAVAAAQLAIADGNLTLAENIKNKIAVILGTGTSGLEYVEEEFYLLRTFGVSKMRPYTGIAAFGGALSSEISRSLGLTGSSITISTGCTGAVDAMGYTLNVIRNGSVDIALTGGADAAVTSGILGAFCQMGAVSTNFNHTPQNASRPFNKDRDGFVIGEGGWVFIFEELDHALRRGAKIYSEVAGYGSTCDAYHMSRPMPSGKYSVEAMKLALLDAMIYPDEVDYINAYGNATPINDSYETMVIKNVFGQHAYKLMISSTKSMIGHAIGACGASGVAAALLAIYEGIVHPTVNYETPDPACDLDYVPNTAKKHEVKVALCNTIAFGSKNSVIVLRKFE
jgi:3-oxoacyl-[acyl-carrier-protein] synthase II